MELRYATSELERQCTEARHMQRTLGAQVAKALRLRIDDLRAAERMSDLLQMTGRWEELSADRAGQWSARLTANWRLIVESGGQEPAAATGPAEPVVPLAGNKPADPKDDVIAVGLVVEIIDYHR